jgi:REP element-mobilizing transposase RayT
VDPVPLYSAAPDKIAYQLRYAWTAWPSQRPFAQCPLQLIEDTKPHWEQDRLRVLEFRWLPERIQILFSATPDIAPVFVAARAKGRLDHAIRATGLRMPFSRKVAVRSIGDNTRRDVEAYIERQVSKERLADPRWAAELETLAFCDEAVDLAQPMESLSGRYWYNLHVVLVCQRHEALCDRNVLAILREKCPLIAAKKGHAISRLSAMPDHLHVALRGTIEESPAQIALAYQNNLAYSLGQKPIWSPGFYVGTFSEYSTQAIRNAVAGEVLEDSEFG